MAIVYRMFCTPVCDVCGRKEDPEGYIEWFDDEKEFMTQANGLLAGPFWHRDRTTWRILCEACSTDCDICDPEVVE